jgi:hypothetical protein
LRLSLFLRFDFRKRLNLPSPCVAKGKTVIGFIVQFVTHGVLSLQKKRPQGAFTAYFKNYHLQQGGNQMKKFLFLIFMMTALAVFSAGSLSAEEEGTDKNRFQLFNAEYKSTFVQKSKTTGFDEKKLFKIDTKTGETWMLIDVMVEGRDRKYWKKIEAEK